MKKLMIMSLLTIVLVTTNSKAEFAAEDLEIADMTNFPEIKTYGINSNIGFELVNGNAKPVWITVVNGSKTMLNAQKIEGHSALKFNDSIQKEIDIKEKTTLAIWCHEPKTPIIERGWFGLGTVTITPTPNNIFNFAPGKTIYITLDKNYNIVATQPVLKGGRNVTSSGLNLNNNVVIDVTGLSQSCPTK